GREPRGGDNDTFSRWPILLRRHAFARQTRGSGFTLPTRLHGAAAAAGYPGRAGGGTAPFRSLTSPRHTAGWRASAGPARRPPRGVAKARPRGQAWMSVSTIPPAAVDEGRRARLHVALGGFTLLVVAGVQALLDPALPIDLLYVLPVAVIALAGGRPMGVAAGVLAAVLRSVVETWSGVASVHPAMALLSFLLAVLVYVLTAWFAAEITTAAQRARASALTDPLTGLGNRRYFEDVAERELNRSRRYGRPLALAFINIVNFRSVNEERG